MYRNNVQMYQSNLYLPSPETATVSTLWSVHCSVRDGHQFFIELYNSICPCSGMFILSLGIACVAVGCGVGVVWVGLIEQ